MIAAETPSVWARLTEPSVLLSALTLLTLIATWVRSSLVSRRDRRWAREDREEAARDLRGLKESVEITHAKIDENTEISTAAFKEANDVNLKIKSVADAMRSAAEQEFELSKKRFEESERRFEESKKLNQQEEPNG